MVLLLRPSGQRQQPGVCTSAPLMRCQGDPNPREEPGPEEPPGAPVTPQPQRCPPARPQRWAETLLSPTPAPHSANPEGTPRPEIKTLRGGGKAAAPRPPPPGEPSPLDDRGEQLRELLHLEGRVGGGEQRPHGHVPARLRRGPRAARRHLAAALGQGAPRRRDGGPGHTGSDAPPTRAARLPIGEEGPGPSACAVHESASLRAAHAQCGGGRRQMNPQRYKTGSCS